MVALLETAKVPETSRAFAVGVWFTPTLPYTASVLDSVAAPELTANPLANVAVPDLTANPDENVVLPETANVLDSVAAPDEANVFVANPEENVALLETAKVLDSVAAPELTANPLANVAVPDLTANPEENVAFPETAKVLDNVAAPEEANVLVANPLVNVALPETANVLDNVADPDETARPLENVPMFAEKFPNWSRDTMVEPVELGVAFVDIVKGVVPFDSCPATVNI